MLWTKKITVSYHRVEAAEDNYFDNLYDYMETMLSSDNKLGSFEAGELKYQWELLEKIETPEAPTYMFSLVKERVAWPVVINDDGTRTELGVVNGMVGDLSYGIVNPAYQFMLCFATGAGGCVSHFKKLLGQFSPEGVVRLNPIYEQHIDEKVLSWDSFKKLSVSMNMPSGEDVTNFLTTKAGQTMTLVGHLGGLKLDITVSSGNGKETLSSMLVKDFIPELLANDLCTSLTVKGSDFDNAAMEQFDLKNAQIKYSEQLEVEGNYISDSDAKQVLMRALNERASLLFTTQGERN